MEGGDKVSSPEFLAGQNKVPRMHLKEARLRVEEALGTCLLPSLQLVPANPAVGQEIWEVMCLLPYEVRLPSSNLIILVKNHFWTLNGLTKRILYC